MAFRAATLTSVGRRSRPDGRDNGAAERLPQGRQSRTTRPCSCFWPKRKALLGLLQARCRPTPITELSRLVTDKRHFRFWKLTTRFAL